MLPVADMGPVVAKLLRRLEAIDAPPSTKVSLGWDGTRIIANTGDYNKLTKSLPIERVVVTRGETEEEVAASFRVAVCRLQQSLAGKTTKGRGRVPRGGHAWRTQARRDGVARGCLGE